MLQWSFLIPLFPLISFIFILLFGKKWNERSGIIGTFFIGLAFIYSVILLLLKMNGETFQGIWRFLTIGDSIIHFGYEVTSLNTLMLVLVSFISLMVHIYSLSYMKNDSRFSIYFCYLSFFTFSMLSLSLSSNLLQTFFFWELVGLGSFLLIGFYYYKEEAKKAALKAFLMTKIADAGFLLGILLLYKEVGSFEYIVIFDQIHHGNVSTNIITISCILLFIGAVGKSGQFPFHSWLPDAMEGPTPVSALIHAATMVAAGVYLVAALYPLFEASETAMNVIAVVGAFTAIFAATIACVQKDIKKVLAYSTVSQLGFMMLSLGVFGYVAGVFHLITHAVFKALLFLTAGSVIHAVHTQNIDEMGGLFKKLPYTGVFFLIGALSISGIPFFAGFFSKDEILHAVWLNESYFLFFIALLAASLTAFYMFRLFFLIFVKSYRGEETIIHEPNRRMSYPMGILAGSALLVGLIDTPFFQSFLSQFLYADHTHVHHEEHGPSWIIFTASILSVVSIFTAYFIYVKEKIHTYKLMDWFWPISILAKNKFYIDELYRFVFVIPINFVGEVLKGFERNFVIKGNNSVKDTIIFLSRIARKIQDGQTQTVAIVAIAGLAVIIFLLTITGGYW